jgi:hypothetical protein
MKAAALTTEEQLLRTVATGSVAFVATFAAASAALQPHAVPLSAAFAGVDAGPLSITPTHVTTGARAQDPSQLANCQTDAARPAAAQRTWWRACASPPPARSPSWPGRSAHTR